MTSANDLVPAGASFQTSAGDGLVSDMGSLLNLGFTDPDGGEHEIIWAKPGIPVEQGLRRAEWTYIEFE